MFYENEGGNCCIELRTILIKELLFKKSLGTGCSEEGKEEGLNYVHLGQDGRGRVKMCNFDDVYQYTPW